MNVLVIEDDRKIACLLERGLNENGHCVSVSWDGNEGTERMLSGSYDAALLDILLPGIDGLAVLERVRARRCKTPIMMLTAVDTVQKLVEAFDLGADDYLVKPFMVEILLARLGAISRRQQSAERSTLRAGDLILDLNQRTVIQNGRPIHLTRKQCDLLDLLMRRRGPVTSRGELVETGWGHQAIVKDNTLDVYVHGLRVKLESNSAVQQELIRTIHGTGYMLVDQ